MDHNEDEILKDALRRIDWPQPDAALKGRIMAAAQTAQFPAHAVAARRPAFGHMLRLCAALAVFFAAGFFSGTLSRGEDAGYKRLASGGATYAALFGGGSDTLSRWMY